MSVQLDEVKRIKARIAKCEKRITEGRDTYKEGESETARKARLEKRLKALNGQA